MDECEEVGVKAKIREFARRVRAAAKTLSRAQ
jgi:hypothetical protein